MVPEFTCHNILLPDGSRTLPGGAPPIKTHPWLQGALRAFRSVLPGDPSGYRVADLGCLEGGYAVELARAGYQVLGLEVREGNMAACRYVQERVDLPNLEFVQDDAWNLEQHGGFDAIFCSGLLYHLDRPAAFLRMLGSCTRRVLVLQTHYATARPNPHFQLSELEENEGLEGRWYREYGSEEQFADRESYKWSSWENHRSFWLRREHLLQAILDAGFGMVAQTYDFLGPNIPRAMAQDGPAKVDRGSFVGVKVPA